MEPSEKTRDSRDIDKFTQGSKVKLPKDKVFTTARPDKQKKEKASSKKIGLPKLLKKLPKLNAPTQSNKIKTVKKKGKGFQVKGGKRGAKMGDLLPSNLEEEKERFYQSLKPYEYFEARWAELEASSVNIPIEIRTRNKEMVEYATYNPQFQYTFEVDSRVPYSETADKRYVPIAKKILDATLIYYSKHKDERVILQGQQHLRHSHNPRVYFYKADNLYYNSFGKIVTISQTEAKFRSYIEELGVKLITEQEHNYLNQAAAKDILESYSGTQRLNDLYDRVLHLHPEDGALDQKKFFKNSDDLYQRPLFDFSPHSQSENINEERRSGFLNVADPKEPVIMLQFTSKTVAPTKVVHLPKSVHSKLIVCLPVIYREKMLMNVLNHEIGTHYCRRYNEQLQSWSSRRQKFNLLGLGTSEFIASEEGLASINQAYE